MEHWYTAFHLALIEVTIKLCCIFFKASACSPLYTADILLNQNYM